MRDYGAQPGNIRYQIGRGLNAIDDATMRADLPRVQDGVRLLKAKAMVYLVRAKRVAEYDAVTPAGDTWTAHFEAAMQRMEVILSVLTDFNLYGYKEEHVGDGADLLEGFDESS